MGLGMKKPLQPFKARKRAATKARAKIKKARFKRKEWVRRSMPVTR